MKLFAAALTAALLTASAAGAAEFVTNGGFENSSYSHNTQFGASFGGQGVTGWTGLGNDSSAQHLEFYYRGGTQTSENATNQYGDPLGYFWPSFNALSPTGGNFVGLDSDISYAGQISQTISGLTVGKSYTLTFDWAGGQLANRTGPTYDAFHVDFGGDTFDTSTVNVASQGFSGWMSESHTFIAHSTSQALTFLAVGGPGSLPPIAALDSVSLKGGVPEPGIWAMMLVGFGGLGSLLRRRRAIAAA